MKSTFLIPLLLLTQALTPAHADTFDSRAVLDMTASTSLDAAIKRGKADNKRVLVFVLDEKKTNNAMHIKGMLEFDETKKLVKDQFLIVVTDFKNKGVRDVVGKEPTDRPFYVLFNTDGAVAQKGVSAMGGSAGNKLVKEWTGK